MGGIMHKRFYSSPQGFTIVELIVVIVVIAILAAIAIVGYGWVSGDARDTARRAAARDVQKAAAALALKKQVTSWGHNSIALNSATKLCERASGAAGTWNGSMWVADKAYHASNGCTLGDMLIANSLTPADFWDKIPKNEEAYKTRVGTQLVGDCQGGGTHRGIYLFYYVKNPTAEETKVMNDLATTCASQVTRMRDTYKMKTAIKIAEF